MKRSVALTLSLLGPLTTACGSTREPLPAAPPPSPAATAAEQHGGTQPEDRRHQNTIRWATASEVDNFGFDIYRAERQEGPFTRLNDSPIAGSGTSDLPTSYEYVDSTIEPDREYFYYIESISIHGEREKFTPTYRAAPKAGPEELEDKGQAD
jgi:hypothetical protein